MNVTPNQAARILERLLQTQDSPPVYLEGPPGVGKSSVIHQVAQKLGLEVTDVRAAYLTPPDLIGLPALERDSGRTTYFLPEFLPHDGAGLLSRMEGWKPAAEIVMQHHEMHDGAGYPAGLKAEAICPGAKILAIVDAFEAVMLKHSHRGHSSSLLRAIAEVNACNNQFAPEWIGPFNTVIRGMIEA